MTYLFGQPSAPWGEPKPHGRKPIWTNTPYAPYATEEPVEAPKPPPPRPPPPVAPYGQPVAEQARREPETLTPALAAQLAHVGRMSLHELREALRAAGISPAGSLVTLQGRLSQKLQGHSCDAPPFVASIAMASSGAASEPAKAARRGSERAHVVGADAAGGGPSTVGSTMRW